MDPDQNLKEQRELAAKDWTGQETFDMAWEEIVQMHDDLIRLCDLVQSLDQWIVKGGFYPARWRR